MKKKLIALITALTLCAGVVVGTTLAYYSAKTTTVTNTFTYSPDENPGPIIEEPLWKPDTPLTPEKTIPKNPYVTLTNKDAELEYWAAIVIKGNDKESIETLKTLGQILATGTTPGVKYIFAYDPATGKRIPADGAPATPDPNNPLHWKHETDTIQKNNGIATVKGWSNNYIYEMDADGTVYAYYNTKLSKGTPSSEAVFQSLQMNKEISHFLDGLTDEQAAKPVFNIDVQGYVVSSFDDRTATPTPWADCKTAMLAAFPDVFTGRTPASTPPYPES